MALLCAVNFYREWDVTTKSLVSVCPYTIGTDRVGQYGYSTSLGPGGDSFGKRQVFALWVVVWLHDGWLNYLMC